MEITINNQRLPIDKEPVALSELLISQGIPQKGVAIALNNRVVPKTAWSSTDVKSGDSITVIHAVCGG